jgi:hypothetical protein
MFDRHVDLSLKMVKVCDFWRSEGSDVMILRAKTLNAQVGVYCGTFPAKNFFINFISNFNCGEFVSFSQLTEGHIEGMQIPLKGSTVLRRPI